MNVTFVKAQGTYGLLSAEEKTKVKLAQVANAANLKIPRRPLWDRTTSGEELQQLEREAFLAWRKGLSELQEIEGITLTPYEKNLEFWRQLWRVIERSDVSIKFSLAFCNGFSFLFLLNFVRLLFKLSMHEILCCFDAKTSSDMSQKQVKRK